MTKQIATTVGAILIVVGLLGFAVPGLMGMHLGMAHNLIHLVSGALALYFGLKGSTDSARTFCTVFGAIYGALGLVGFLAGGPDKMLTVIPNQLILGAMDHIVHIVLGAVFLFAGLYKKPLEAHPRAH
jgi:hypothetical protein